MGESAEKSGKARVSHVISWVKIGIRACSSIPHCPFPGQPGDRSPPKPERRLRMPPLPSTKTASICSVSGTRFSFVHDAILSRVFGRSRRSSKANAKNGRRQEKYSQSSLSRVWDWLSLRILLTGGQTTEGLNADARRWTQMHANGPNGTAHRWPASKPRAADAAARDGTEIAEAAGGICAHLRPSACICVRPSLLPCGTDPLREPRSALRRGTKHLRSSTDFVTRKDCFVGSVDFAGQPEPGWL